MRDLYFQFLSRFLVRLYYHRVRLLGGENLPAAGPVLYLGLHRNGAVDGYLYKSKLPRARFMISVQLRRSLLGRIFFDGIEVAREKDGKDDAVDNAAALRQSVDALKAGGALFIMPEGTSDLGHRHLPFKKGAARILAAALAEGIRPTVIPLGIHYERAWAWQSDAEIVAGPPLDLDLPAGSEGPAAVAQLHKRIVAALEALAVQAPDADTFARRERTAYAATLGTGRSYFAALKALEAGLPDAEAAQAEFDASVADAPLFRHQGVPLVPIRHAWAYALYALVLAPFVGAACLLNLPPLLIAREAGRRFADAPNTITLWRLLTGAPALALWAGGLLAWATAADNLPAWGAYAAVSWLGLRSLYRFKKLAVSLGNLVCASSLRPRLLAMHQRLDAALRATGV
ncbi:MAG TPA: 1-acyl-sn-glycerol-3-phosphate acyltransferase [Rhodocyclaceae bacterium]|nr:1-acyl-sn-glycerol-3-phosphate acyltransferase [Rhodocyclaceae bacterium]